MYYFYILYQLFGKKKNFFRYIGELPIFLIFNLIFYFFFPLSLCLIIIFIIFIFIIFNLSVLCTEFFTLPLYSIFASNSCLSCEFYLAYHSVFVLFLLSEKL